MNCVYCGEEIETGKIVKGMHYNCYHRNRHDSYQQAPFNCTSAEMMDMDLTGYDLHRAQRILQTAWR